MSRFGPQYFDAWLGVGRLSREMRAHSVGDVGYDRPLLGIEEGGAAQ